MPDIERRDVLVVGGGMAGVSIGYELSADRHVGVLDMETTLAFHTTGRSAAMFLEGYGGPAIRALTTASRAFLEQPAGVLDKSPLAPLPSLYIARPGRGAVAEQLHRDILAHVPDAELLDGDEATRHAGVLRAGYVERAVLEPGSREIDVHALHQGYLHGLRRNGGTVVTTSRVATAERGDGLWQVADGRGQRFAAPVVVNAAGAWADVVASLFGARPVGVRALRRCAFTVAAPAGIDPRAMPMVADIDEAFYFKPEAGQFLCSPADETPQPPGDAKPDEREIARAIEAINEATTLGVRSVRSSWAGLRTFVADRVPVAGYDPEVDGLFWFVAQGGYGIQTAPALARSGAALVRHAAVPDDVAARGLRAEALSPGRFVSETLPDRPSATPRRGPHSPP
jgi:D-arginine dehydrogenase